MKSRSGCFSSETCCFPLETRNTLSGTDNQLDYHTMNKEFPGIKCLGVENPEMVTTTGINNSRNSRELIHQRYYPRRGGSQRIMLRTALRLCPLTDEGVMIRPEEPKQPSSLSSICAQPQRKATTRGDRTVFFYMTKGSCRTIWNASP